MKSKSVGKWETKDPKKKRGMCRGMMGSEGKINFKGRRGNREEGKREREEEKAGEEKELRKRKGKRRGRRRKGKGK